MTRKELAAKKAKEELDFIASLKGKIITGVEKGKFRRTSVWREFRKRFEGKLDPITNKKVGKGFQLHHLVLDPRRYTELNMNHYVPHNGTTHDLIHYLYDYYISDRDILKRIKKELDKMVELNDGKRIRDFK